jgi:hypothetical protein
VSRERLRSGHVIVTKLLSKFEALYIKKVLREIANQYFRLAKSLRRRLKKMIVKTPTSKLKLHNKTPCFRLMSRDYAYFVVV